MLLQENVKKAEYKWGKKGKLQVFYDNKTLI